MSIFPSEIRPRAEAMLPRKQYELFVGGYDSLGHARVVEAIYAR
jgi:hypothetical protein